jgi:hypothetical protein
MLRETNREEHNNNYNVYLDSGVRNKTKWYIISDFLRFWSGVSRHWSVECVSDLEFLIWFLETALSTWMTKKEDWGTTGRVWTGRDVREKQPENVMNQLSDTLKVIDGSPWEEKDTIWCDGKKIRLIDEKFTRSSAPRGISSRSRSFCFGSLTRADLLGSQNWRIFE